jgi:predicted transcriptional regulator
MILLSQLRHTPTYSAKLARICGYNKDHTHEQLCMLQDKELVRSEAIQNKRYYSVTPKGDELGAACQIIITHFQPKRTQLSVGHGTRIKNPKSHTSCSYLE